MFYKTCLYVQVSVHFRFFLTSLLSSLLAVIVWIITPKFFILNLDSKEKSAVERRLAQVLKSTRENSSADKITEDATGLAKSTETKGIENKVELAREQLQDLDYVQNEARGLPIQSVVDDTDVSTDGDRLKHEELLLKELKVR